MEGKKRSVGGEFLSEQACVLASFDAVVSTYRGMAALARYAVVLLG